MKKRSNLVGLSLVASVTIILVVFALSNNETKADSSQNQSETKNSYTIPQPENTPEYYASSEKSLETYGKLQSWARSKADFPYAGAFIDDQGVLNIRVKGVNSEHEQELIAVFGDHVKVLDAEATLKQLEDVYNLLKENAAMFMEEEIPLSGFHIRETDNKVYIELRDTHNRYIKKIEDVIGEYPFVEYLEVTGTFIED